MTRTILSGWNSWRQPPCRSSNGSGRRGNVSVIAAIALTSIIGMAGMAVDSGRLYVAHERLQAAVDSAVLAGCLQLPYDHDVSNGKVEAAVLDFLEQNYDEATVSSLGPGSEVRSVCLTAQVTVPMTLMNVLGIADETISASACGGYNNLEIALVLDNTISMSGAPLTNTKIAAAELVDLVMPDGGSASSKVGLVGFQGKVRVGSGVDGYSAGCRNANGTLNSTDYNSCFRALTETLPLSNDKTTIQNRINQMQASWYYSGTVISEGIRWGRHVLTPEAPYTEGVDPDENPEIRKILIILTDGDSEDGMCNTDGSLKTIAYPQYGFMYNSYYGMGVTNCHCDDWGCMDQAILDEAQEAKDAGIEIFAIRYGNSDTVDRQIMKAIASSKTGTDDHYYDTPSSADIQDMFRKIGQQLGLRLLN